MPPPRQRMAAIDPVVNVWERQDFEVYPDHLRDFWERIRIEEKGTVGIDIEEMLARMDAAQIEIAVTQYGFLGGHIYPHWFGLAPNHALYYPYYAKCAELEVPVQIQVGHSAQRRMPTVARPMLLDEVAIALPELKLFAIHTGWPWIQ